MLFSLGANVAEYALHHTHEDKQGKKKKIVAIHSDDSI